MTPGLKCSPTEVFVATLRLKSSRRGERSLPLPVNRETLSRVDKPRYLANEARYPNPEPSCFEPRRVYLLPVDGSVFVPRRLPISARDCGPVASAGQLDHGNRRDPSGPGSWP